MDSRNFSKTSHRRVMIVCFLLLIQVNSQYSGCTFAKVADDATAAPDGGLFSSFTFPSVSQKAVVAFTGFDVAQLIGLYHSNSTNSLTYFIDTKKSRELTGTQYTGLVRGCNSGSSSQDFISYIARHSGGPSVVLGSLQGSTRTFTTIATVSTNVPGKSYRFTDFGDTCVNGNTGTVVFLAESSGGTGIYASTVSGSSRTLSKIADFTDTVPGTSLPYTYLSAPRIGGNYVAFFGSHYPGNPPARPALVLYNLSGGGFTLIASFQTAIPGFPAQTFSGFTSPAIDFNGNYVAFVAQGSGDYWGVIRYQRSNGALLNIADQTTVPNGYSIPFTGFQGTPSVGEDGRVVFRIVHEPNPITGVWMWPNAKPYIQIAGLGNTLSGVGTINRIDRIGFGENGFHGNTVAFTATLKGTGTQTRAGIYRCTLSNFDVKESLINMTDIV